MQTPGGAASEFVNFFTLLVCLMDRISHPVSKTGSFGSTRCWRRAVKILVGDVNRKRFSNDLSRARLLLLAFSSLSRFPGRTGV